MQKPLQEYVRGLYGGYTSEATRKAGGDGMDFSNVPISANPLDLALRLSKADTMLPKPLSALPNYVDQEALQAIRAMLSVPFMAGGLGAEIRTPPQAEPPATPAGRIASIRQAQMASPTQEAQQTEPQTEPKQQPAQATRKADIRNLWTQVNALGMNIPDVRRRHAFIANEIERMKGEGEIDEKSASVMHNWNNSLNVAEEDRRIDDRLLWLLMIASMFQR